MPARSVHRAAVLPAARNAISRPRRTSGDDRPRARPGAALSAVPAAPAPAPAPLVAVPVPVFSAAAPQPVPAPRAAATVLVEVGVSGADALHAATQLAGRIRDLLDAEQPTGADLMTSVGVRLGPLPVAAPQPPVEAPAAAPVATSGQTGSIVLYPSRRVALVDAAPVTLTRREFDLLVHLAQNPGRVFGRPQLLRTVWGHQVICGERTVDVHVRRLRAKLGAAAMGISTVRGVGYRLEPTDLVTVVEE
jgi:hypothetical protein